MTKLSPQARGTVKVIFLTLFLDLVGFSIIFPLFPQLIDYYLRLNSENFLLKAIFNLMENITTLGGVAQTISPIVLFGGILGALYSFLQFVFTPFWGSLSDRIGRRPILLISVSGICLSYVIWFFSGNFTLLILSRLIGGIMGGNISTATAVMSDVTDEKTRTRGMAFVGMAFGAGFIFGPAIGGIASLMRLDEHFPVLKTWGVNPFSFPALIAFALAVINLIFIVMAFKETLPRERRGEHPSLRSANILKLLKPFGNKQINLTNFSYFSYILAFAGMEFTLTFLAVERLNYTSLQNGTMFIFIGTLMALIQGGYVRKYAHSVGEKKMALFGLFLLIPGLILLSRLHTEKILYLSLSFIAMGSALIIPCLTALVSFCATKETQGQVLGTFRSLGALARVIGPFAASVIYWRFGASTAYLVGTGMLFIPIALVSRIKIKSQ